MRQMDIGQCVTATALSLKERIMSYEIDLDPYLSSFQSDSTKFSAIGDAECDYLPHVHLVLKGPS